MLGLVCIVKFL